MPLQVWNLTNCKLRANLAGHQGYINTVTVSPDGSLCASGGKVPLFLCASPLHSILPRNLQGYRKCCLSQQLQSLQEILQTAVRHPSAFIWRLKVLMCPGGCRPLRWSDAKSGKC